MQIKDLQWFVCAVERSSLHAAAEAMGVTQPALTKSVRRLEAELGVRLLERTARGVAPTAIGQALFQRARGLGQWLHDTRVLMQDLKIGQAGELRVGVVPALVDSVMTPVLAAFLEDGAGVRFQTSVQLSGVLLQQLEAGSLDLAIAAIDPDKPSPALNCQRLGTQHSYIVARKEHPLHRRRFSLQDLAQQPWVLPPVNVTLRTWVDALFASAGVPAAPAFVYTDATPAVFAKLVRRTSLLTVMTDDSLSGAGGVGLAALGEPAPAWALQMGLFWRRSAYFSAPMEQFRERAVQAFDARAARVGREAQARPARR
ncbi:LysR family transcriptional regulator [Variovorax sp.]|uniref:LysR family transcriptional regulator n=1 Tax=Variovorax sp. TaxID=1871043 RepID=UPI002D481629|nr:LysR family transcriptional regulator [Variovorax sp.]HYP85789.1 LysR family transcriptional regulator [Variovorax sp.]